MDNTQFGAGEIRFRGSAHRDQDDHEYGVEIDSCNAARHSRTEDAQRCCGNDAPLSYTHRKSLHE